MSRRRPPVPPPPPGCVQVWPVKLVCAGRGEHPRALLYRLIDGREVSQGEVVLWQGDSPEKAWAGEIPVYRFTCPRCGRDVPLRLPTLLAAIDASRKIHPDRAGAVVDIATVQAVLA